MHIYISFYPDLSSLELHASISRLFVASSPSNLTPKLKLHNTITSSHKLISAFLALWYSAAIYLPYQRIAGTHSQRDNSAHTYLSKTIVEVIMHH
jgi:hypothetical protein